MVIDAVRYYFGRDRTRHHASQTHIPFPINSFSPYVRKCTGPNQSGHSYTWPFPTATVYTSTLVSTAD